MKLILEQIPADLILLCVMAAFVYQRHRPV